MVRGLSSLGSRTRTVLVVAAALCLLAVLPSDPAAAGGVRCDGRQATIVGTSGNDVLVGTQGPDVINGLGAHDEIDGRGGRDRICGSNGPDTITGGGGNDRLFGGGDHDIIFGGDDDDDIFGFTGGDLLSGQEGKDVILGGEGNEAFAEGGGIAGGPGDDDLFGGGGEDNMRGHGGNDDLQGGADDDDLNGGDDTDACTQGEGTGPNVNCEVADLSVDVASPATAPEGDITYTVTVTNNGPSTVAYTLALEEFDSDLLCTGGEGSTSEPELAEGETRSQMHIVTCVIEGPEGEVTLEATVTGPFDTDGANDNDNSTTAVT